MVITVPMPVKSKSGNLLAWLIRSPEPGHPVRVSDFHFIGKPPAEGDAMGSDFRRFINGINARLKDNDNG